MDMLGSTTTTDGHDPYIRDAGPRGDFTIDQDWARYSRADHDRWDRLFARQIALLRDRAAPEFLRGLEVLALGEAGIPHFGRLSERLMARTGWQVVAVPGLIPEHAFFEHLANRRFPAGHFIRTEEQLDYLQAPDVFHDVFGHVPLLAEPVFADYMQAYGEGGLRSIGFGALEKLARLYWYTVEFGLIRQPEGLRIYGAGILSSRRESLYALDSAAPHRVRFDLERVMRSRFRIDMMQPTYFVIDSFADLLRQTRDADFAPLYARLADAEDIAHDALVPGDQLISHGQAPA